MSDKKIPVSTQANLSINEKCLKNIFIAGLNSDNRPVAEKYGEGLPLEKNEISAKLDPPPPYHL
ncbi:hypothetical protein Glove_529g2 [Diversispora epigaea]|uniref:Uncharacterized protein n=1 Tax=Diversispora epigaea TaxID=1348612 RepID=A0A397GJ99_9GLOM|nr:hypothetical protein Glove_529g2 [Diversispora epigaea]